jgi:hypothetical protein
MIHRTFNTLDPKGEIAVVERPEGTVKVVFYTGSGEKKQEHVGITLERQVAFELAMEMLQHLYRLGPAA